MRPCFSVCTGFTLLIVLSNNILLLGLIENCIFNVQMVYYLYTKPEPKLAFINYV